MTSLVAVRLDLADESKRTRRRRQEIVWVQYLSYTFGSAVGRLEALGRETGQGGLRVGWSVFRAWQLACLLHPVTIPPVDAAPGTASSGAR